MIPNVIPQARENGLVLQELEDELLVYDLDRHKAHCLTGAAGLVWRHCDGKTSVSELTTLLQKEYRAPVDEEVVWVALQRLGKAHLLRERVTPPTDASFRSSRRDLMRKLSVVGGIAVISIIAPQAANAATCLVGVSCQNQCIDMSNPSPTPCGYDCNCAGHGGTQAGNCTSGSICRQSKNGGGVVLSGTCCTIGKK
jgi:hypothetical protein